MRDIATTLLDVVGLLLVTAGIVGGLWLEIGPWALIPGGVVVLAGSQLASRGVSREPVRPS